MDDVTNSQKRKRDCPLFFFEKRKRECFLYAKHKNTPLLLSKCTKKGAEFVQNKKILLKVKKIFKKGIYKLAYMWYTMRNLLWGVRAKHDTL